MTAHGKYICLEALGVWREHRGAPPREVVVSLGNATLLLKDLDERPLGHWALAGVVRLGLDGAAAIYAMAADGETLTIRDREMIEAIAALSRPRLAAGTATGARRRRLPIGPILGLAVLAALAVAVPRLIRADAARLVPPERAAELGDRLLIRLIERGGPPCSDPEAARALGVLAARLAPGAPPRVRVVALGTTPAALLPGDTLLIDQHLLRNAPPEEVAGWAAMALGVDPLASLLAATGPAAELGYLLTGHLTEAALARATDAIAAPLDSAGADAAAARLAAAGIDPGPFAAASGARQPATTVAGEPLFDASLRRALSGACG